MSPFPMLHLPETAQVVFGQQRLTQPELLQRAAGVARHLREAFGIQPGDRVGLMMVPALEVVPSMLGIWMAGGTYVPLDPLLPDERLLHIVNDAGLRGIVTQRRHTLTLSLLASQLRKPLPWVAADDPRQVPPALGAEARIAAPPQQAAYLIYTSGSTGEPKGVVCAFGGLLNLVGAWREALELGPRTRYLQFASINFDASVVEIFPTLLAGGTVVQGSREELLPGRRLASFLREHHVTDLCLPPSVLGALGDCAGEVPDLGCVVMAGERCPAPLAARWRAAGRRVFNAYGPTEATVCATLYAVQGHEDSVPLGEALPGVRLRIVDAGGQDCPAGTPGELWVGGLGVAAGYHGKPELTARRFPRDSQGQPWYRTGDEVVRHSNGALHFLGRLDQQVKLRGLRIELEAIDQALYAVPGVAQAAARLFEEVDAQGTTHGVLMACYSVQPGHTLTHEALRAHLASTLPDYMLPNHLMELPSLPLMPHLGKVDRQALPPPPRHGATVRAEDVRAASPLDKLCRCFEQVLRAPAGSLQADTHFFEAGGDSLTVAHLLARIEEDFGVVLPARHVYLHPTPTALLPACLGEPGSTASQASNEMARLEADARYVPPAQWAWSARAEHPPRTLLLTGATGFLGVHLLAALAPRVERIYCLVRARGAAEAQARLKASATRYGVSLPWEEGRIHPLAGDITLAGLGLEGDTWRELAFQCDAVVHSAASISYILPYAEIGRPNVEGTQNALAFATAERLKAFHHVSSLGVFGAMATLQGLTVLDEDFELERSLPVMQYENGYTRAKWVAERIITQAREAGLPASIYRPGFIQGHSQTGIGNVDDLFCRMLVGTVQQGVFPNIPDKHWLLVPVDYVASAMAHIILTQPPGNTYNLSSPYQEEPPHNALFEELNALGYPVRCVPLHVWLRQLAHLGPDNALFPLVGLLREKAYHGTRTMLELHHRTAEVRMDHTLAALAGTGLRCPPIDRHLLRRYVEHLLPKAR